jgi:hypothetical protein
VTWPVVEITATTPEHAVVVGELVVGEFTGLCQTISQGGRTVKLEDTTETGTEMTEADVRYYYRTFEDQPEYLYSHY